MNTESTTRRTEATARKAYAARIQRVVDHIQENLDGDLSLEVLAGIAHFSPYHFHRQFRAWTGVGVGRLVRLLRLRWAASQLALNPERSVTAIALESGFQSTDAFSRAFREASGRSPTAFRRSPVWSNSELIDFQERLQEHSMNTNVEIIDFPATRLAAVEHRGPMEQEYAAIARLIAWRRANGVSPDRGKTFSIQHVDPAAVAPENYRIDICVSFDGPIGENPQGVIAKEIPGGRCARLRHSGSRDYISEADYLYRIWLPGSGEELRDFPPFFHFVNVGPDVRDEEMITDVYLPLR